MMTTHRYVSALCALFVGALLLTPSAAAQGLFDRLKEAAANTVNEAKEAATNAAMDEGMNQAGFLLLAEGGFAGTATPWVQEDEPVAFAEIPGNAYVSADRLALVLCQPGALDGIVFQGDFSNVTGSTDLAFADNAFAVFLVQDGRAVPMRNNAGQLGSFTAGQLSLKPGESGGVMGTVSLAIGEDAVNRSFLAELFARSRVVEIEGSFRATPVESIDQISCDSGASSQAAPRNAPSNAAPAPSYAASANPSARTARRSEAVASAQSEAWGASAQSPPQPEARGAAEQRRRADAQQRSGEAAEPEIFVVVEDPPELIGGLDGLQQHVRYPEAARRAGIEGTVFVQFVVDEQGRAVDPVCVRDPGGDTCEEAVRVIRASTFSPGMQRGKPVKVRFSLPVKFRMR